MPITTQNELFHIKLSICAMDSQVNIGLYMLFDTGVALNTGYLLYHQQIMKKHPVMVSGFENSDGANPFDPIKLWGVIFSP